MQWQGTTDTQQWHTPPTSPSCLFSTLVQSVHIMKQTNQETRNRQQHIIHQLHTYYRLHMSFTKLRLQLHGKCSPKSDRIPLIPNKPDRIPYSGDNYTDIQLQYPFQYWYHHLKKCEKSLFIICNICSWTHQHSYWT